MEIHPKDFQVESPPPEPEELDGGGVEEQSDYVLDGEKGDELGTAGQKGSGWDDELPRLDVLGTRRNMSRFGPPSINADYNLRYVFYHTWRGQFVQIVEFVLLSILAVYVSQFPYMVIPGEIISISSVSIYLYFPFWILLPAFTVLRILYSMYNVKFTIDHRGVQAQVGLVSLSLRQPLLRWEDIRGVEPVQTLWERLLGIGTIEIGSAMTDHPEVEMHRVSHPHAIISLINRERDLHKKRPKKDKKTGSSGELLQK